VGKKIWMIATYIAMLAAGPILAQTPEMAAIKSAADALGGVDRVRAIKTLVMEGEGTNPNVGQNVTPDAPLTDWKVSEYRKTIDLQHWRLHFQQRRDAKFEFSMANINRQNFVLDGDLSFNVDREGKPARAPDAVLRDRRIEMLNHPIAIVRAALDGIMVPSDLRNEGKDQAIDLKTAQGDELTLTLDPATHLPASLRWISSSDNLGDIHNQTFYSDYAAAIGLEMPRHFVNKVDFRNYTTTDIRISKNIVDGDPEDLEAPGSVRASAPPQPPPITVDPIEAAPGVWWMKGSGNHSSTLYIFADHKTLFEAPASAAQAKVVIAAARKIVPEKPLTEMIISHHHFDHTGGLRTVVAEGLTIISHQANQQYFRELASRKATLRPDELALHPMPFKFKGVGEIGLLKDKTLEVDLFQMKDNVHSTYNLVAWVPKYRLLSQSDLFDANWYYFLWSDNYFANLKRLGLHFDRDLPVHGSIMTYEEERRVVEERRKSPPHED
jgi:hypothetical protein